jgi:hypothetical protein
VNRENVASLIRYSLNVMRGTGWDAEYVVETSINSKALAGDAALSCTGGAEDSP